MLRFLIDKWGLAELPSKRVKEAKSIAVALTEEAERTDTPRGITLNLDQLKPADQQLEDAAVDTETDHQKALKKLAEFLPSALWEKTKEFAVESAPKLYPLSVRFWETCAASVDWLRGRCEYRLASLYETGGHEVVLSSPDKVDQKYASERNRVVRFLATQKSRAMEGLRDRILDPKGIRSPEEQKHAARSVAAMMGRPTHHNQLDHVKNWMRRAKNDS